MSATVTNRDNTSTASNFGFPAVLTSFSFQIRQEMNVTGNTIRSVGSRLNFKEMPSNFANSRMAELIPGTDLTKMRLAQTMDKDYGKTLEGSSGRCIGRSQSATPATKKGEKTIQAASLSLPVHQDGQ